MFIKWHSAYSYIHENQRPLSLRDGCCQGNNYPDYRNFNRRHDYDQQHNNKHGNGYHTHSSIHNNFHGDIYFRPNRRNYYDYKNPPSKYTPLKDYHHQRYNGPSYHGSRNIQNRVGFSFPDSHNVKEGNGGYRPYIPNHDHGYSKYHEYDSYKNKNGGISPYDHHEEKRKKYKPGLLQSVSIINSAGVVASGPNGYKHFIHDLPPWAEVNRTPERGHHEIRFPGSLDHRGGIEYTEPPKFSHGYNKRPAGYISPYSVEGNPIYIEGNPFEEQEPPNSIKDLYGNKNGPPKDILVGIYQPDYKEYKSTKSNIFRPSPPFYKYSEPDPLYHPDGTPLQTHPTTESTETETPTTKPTPRSTSEIPSKYPDSINAQLPPPTHNTDTRVPYIAATEITQSTPEQQFTVVTQASDATDKKPLIKVLPTQASEQNFTTQTEKEIKLDEINVVSSTEISSPNSTELEENTKSEESNTFLSKVPVLPTQLYFENSTSDKISSITKKDMSQSDKIKQFLSNIPVQDSLKELPFSVPSQELKEIAPNPTVIPLVEISTRTDIFLPTIITERHPSQQESETKSQTEPTTQSDKGNSETDFLQQNSTSTITLNSENKDTSSIINNENNEDNNKKSYISMNEESTNDFIMQMEASESGEMHTVSSETTTVKIESTSLSKNATHDKLKQILESSSEKTALPLFIQSTTERMTVTTIESLFPNKQLNENPVKHRVSTFLDQIHALVNHARSLDYLHHDAIKTASPIEESDW